MSLYLIEREAKRMEREQRKFKQKDGDDMLHKETAFLENKGVDMNAVQCMDVKDEVLTTDGGDTNNVKKRSQEGTPGLARTEHEADDTPMLNSTARSDDITSVPDDIHAVTQKQDSDDSRV